ncbi:N-lysine methyltransferase SETD8 [Sciurus carolinensis]|uniref:N-lysine methyltransferase SETD8 n=1 Tax=Sciurus carolinensis TaxID=30640 RepID=A0AA41MH39_SCICA|nr:N-lysine methyltransferase SETD8 [Sciurus carolinensis]
MARGERICRAIKDLFLHEPEQMLWIAFPSSGRELSCTSRSQMPGETISWNLQEARREKKCWERHTKLREVGGTEDQRRQERSLAPFPNQKSEAAETPKTPTSSCDSTNAAVAKQALKKPLKGKRAPREKAQGKTQQNSKLTDFYPVQRSSRKSKAELQSAERKRIDELIIESGKEEGMKIDLIEGKGRGVIATKQFSRGDFVVEYHGDLIEITDAKKQEALYAQDSSTGLLHVLLSVSEQNLLRGRDPRDKPPGKTDQPQPVRELPDQAARHRWRAPPHPHRLARHRSGGGAAVRLRDRSRASMEAHPWLKH